MVEQAIGNPIPNVVFIRHIPGKELKRPAAELFPEANPYSRS